jgi:Raf kinase inhibitor-like YbhB/YbcL family protein
MTLAIRSTAFPKQGDIPVRYTCDGDDTSPPLEWSGVVSNAKSLVLIVDDPDAPDPRAPKRTYVHWVLYDIPPSATGLPEGATAAQLPRGTSEGLNDWNRTGYGGPCPPIGRHRYFFKLYSLDIALPKLDAATKAKVESAMKDHVLQFAELMGTYERPAGKGAR